MIGLVDYDNIPQLIRNRGPLHVVTRITDVLGVRLAEETELRLRLYGGWFEGPTLSRRAQEIVPILRANFPTVMLRTTKGIRSSLVTRAELALALEFSPEKYLTHTYRPRSLPNNVVCASLPFTACKIPRSCPIAPVHGLLRDSHCPEPGCSVPLAAVLTKPEQKLVDTMLTVDIVHLARTTTETIAVVSADDDFWPGIQAALLHGARIVQVHPLAGRVTPSQYVSLANDRYSQVSF